MRIRSATHNGSIPGCAMYNKALPCSIRWALRKPLRNVVIERGGAVENVEIANHVFSCSACSFWKMDLLAKNKCRLADLYLFSASLWECCFQKLFNESLWLCPPLTFTSSHPLLAGFLVSVSRLFFFWTCRRTCFHWITQCSSLRWVFIFSLHIESCTAEATNPPKPAESLHCLWIVKSEPWNINISAFAFDSFCPLLS